MNKVAELGVEVKGPSLLVPKELSFNGEPGGTSSGATLHDSLDEVVGEIEMVPRIQEQTTQVHAGTIRVIGSKIVGEDVAFQ